MSYYLFTFSTLTNNHIVRIEIMIEEEEERRQWSKVCVDKGDYRAVLLKEQYECDGKFKALVNTKFNAGVDLIIVEIQTGKVVEVVESTNYQYPDEFINTPKENRYIKSLNEFNYIAGIKKTLYVSYLENLNTRQLKRFLDNDIEVKEVGHFDDPEGNGQ